MWELFEKINDIFINNKDIKETFKKKKSNIMVKINYSDGADDFKSGEGVATKNLIELNENPTFSIAYINSEADGREITKGINKVLGNNWIGISVDKSFISKLGFNKSKIALCSIVT